MTNATPDPLPDETPVPREVVLEGKAVGKDSMASLPATDELAAPKKRGRPAGTTTTAVKPSDAAVDLRARVHIGQSSLVFNAVFAVHSVTEFSEAIQKWHDEVKKAWSDTQS